MDTMVRPGVSPILVGFWFRISGKFPEKFQGKSGKVGEILLFLARWYGGFTYHFTVKHQVNVGKYTIY